MKVIILNYPTWTRAGNASVLEHFSGGGNNSSGSSFFFSGSAIAALYENDAFQSEQDFFQYSGN